MKNGNHVTFQGTVKEVNTLANMVHELVFSVEGKEDIALTMSGLHTWVANKMIGDTFNVTTLSGTSQCIGLGVVSAPVAATKKKK